MFPYTEKYTESEYDIQNDDFLYKIKQKCQITFKMLEVFKNKIKNMKLYFVLYINSIIHIL